MHLNIFSRCNKQVTFKDLNIYWCFKSCTKTAIIYSKISKKNKQFQVVSYIFIYFFIVNYRYQNWLL